MGTFINTIAGTDVKWLIGGVLLLALLTVLLTRKALLAAIIIVMGLATLSVLSQESGKRENLIPTIYQLAQGETSKEFIQNDKLALYTHDGVHYLIVMRQNPANAKELDIEVISKKVYDSTRKEWELELLKKGKSIDSSYSTGGLISTTSKGV